MTRAAERDTAEAEADRDAWRANYVEATARALAAEALTDGRLRVLISGVQGFELLEAIRLNGRVAMVGFSAALIGELVSGHGPAGQVLALLRWYLR